MHLIFSTALMFGAHYRPRLSKPVRVWQYEPTCFISAFARQLADFMQIEVLNRQGQFTFFRRLLNYDDWRVAGRPQSTQFLDYQVVNSDIEAETRLTIHLSRRFSAFACSW
jgi:hypothetical protein